MHHPSLPRFPAELQKEHGQHGAAIDEMSGRLAAIAADAAATQQIVETLQRTVCTSALPSPPPPLARLLVLRRRE